MKFSSWPKKLVTDEQHVNQGVLPVYDFHENCTKKHFSLVTKLLPETNILELCYKNALIQGLNHMSYLLHKLFVTKNNPSYSRLALFRIISKHWIPCLWNVISHIIWHMTYTPSPLDPRFQYVLQLWSNWTVFILDTRGTKWYVTRNCISFECMY